MKLPVFGNSVVTRCCRFAWVGVCVCVSMHASGTQKHQMGHVCNDAQVHLQASLQVGAHARNHTWCHRCGTRRHGKNQQPCNLSSMLGIDAETHIWLASLSLGGPNSSFTCFHPRCPTQEKLSAARHANAGCPEPPGRLRGASALSPPAASWMHYIIDHGQWGGMAVLVWATQSLYSCSRLSNDSTDSTGVTVEDSGRPVPADSVHACSLRPDAGSHPNSPVLLQCSALLCCGVGGPQNMRH